MVHSIRAYSRKHVVAAGVFCLMLLGLLVWNQQDYITTQISKTVPSGPPPPPPHSPDHHDPPPPPPDDKQPPPPKDKSPQDESGHDDASTKNPEDSELETSGKTKPRFWTSKGHLLPSVWDYKRPDNVKKIMALVFFGRRQPISILDCYLKRNLKKNGGMLDGVIFVERTSDRKDLALLDRMMKSEPDYEKWHIEMGDSNQFSSGFANSYDRIEDDVLYIKIDDDIVFMEDSVIPSIIQKKVEHPEYYVVSANVVNQPLLSWVHWNLNAIRPYLPDFNSTSSIVGTNFDWRPSKLPAWEGPDMTGFNLDDWEPSEDGVHRWLPVNRTAREHVLDYTPIEHTEYHPYGRGWTQWKIGAQEHFSFLENLEKDELFHYKFNTWDFQFDRMGIQFVAMMGHDINIAKPIEADDENHFSCTMTRKLGRHGVADGRGLAVHYSFGSQRGGMDRTDILERYRSFARDNICEDPMLWTPELEAEEVKKEKEAEKAKKKEQEAKKKAEEEAKKNQEAANASG